MSPKQILTIALVMIALTGQIALAAEPPANVQNVAAALTDGKLTVTWTPVEGAVSYTIYYSHQSILGNGGDYDDFEPVQNVTSFTFDALPLSAPTIFVGVLATDAAGAESEGFETEASVTVTAAPVQPAVSSSSSSSVASSESSSSLNAMPAGENPTTTSTPMALISVQATSETGVLIGFSKPVKIDAVITPEFFIITDSGANVLRITKVTVNAATILLETERQVPAREYTFGLLQPVTAVDGTNATPSTPQVKFTAAGTATVQPPAPTAPAYGRNPALGGVLIAQPPVPATAPPSSPSTGLGLFGVMAASGALTGMKMRRKKRV